MYRFGLLKPSRAAGAETHNAPLLGRCTLGIEVTEVELAARCWLGNIDPQHDLDERGVCAIEASLDWPLPPKGAFLVTIRPDADSIGSMALFVIRGAGVPISQAAIRRISQVAQADRFERGPWPGPRAWPDLMVDLQARGTLPDDCSAASLAAADDSVAPATRVEVIRDWILEGRTPQRYAEVARQRSHRLLSGLQDGSVKVVEIEPGRLALVESRLPQAVQIGYALAPVVLAINPEFAAENAPPYRKVTIAQFAAGHVDLAGVARALNASEAGWGGSDTIIGSPQGTDCNLSVDEIADCIRMNAVADRGENRADRYREVLTNGLTRLQRRSTRVDGDR